MKKIWLCVVGCLFVMASCDRKEFSEAELPAIEIEVTRGGDSSGGEAPHVQNVEEQLVRIWLAFFDPQTRARIDAPYLFTASQITEGRVTVMQYSARVLSTPVHVAVVANPGDGLLKQLAACTSSEALERLETDAYAANFSLPPVMYGMCDHTFDAGTMTAKIDLERLPAKVEIGCDTSGLAAGCEVSALHWENIPTTSSVAASDIPVGRGEVTSSVFQSPIGEPAGVGYPYSYPQGASRGKLKISVHRTDGSMGFFYFLLPESLDRNHWYKYRITLVGKGGTEENPVEAEVHFEVLPWQNETNNIIIGNTYLECDRELYLYVRTFGTVVNPERSFIFRTNVPLSECEVIPQHPDLLKCEMLKAKGGAMIKFTTRENVFYEFHPREQTSIVIKAGNIRRTVQVTLIPLMEINPKRPNVIMVWPGHEFYNQAVKYGGLYVHTPFTDRGYADNQHPNPNMCRMIEVYDMDYEPSLAGQQHSFRNFETWDNGLYKEYREDFYGYWDTLNNCGKSSEDKLERKGKNVAENLGNGWRIPTEYELRAMYQAWAHFGRSNEEGGSDTPPSAYRTEKEKQLYLDARKFYKRFFCDQNHLYGCTTFSEYYARPTTVAQHFRYVWNGTTWHPNTFSLDYPYRNMVLIRPVRDYAGSSTHYDKDTWKQQ